MNVTPKKAIIGLISIVIMMWLYGYISASNDLNSGKMSVFSAAIEIKTLNGISSHGYRTFVMNNTTIPETVQKWQNRDKKIAQEKKDAERRKINEKLLSGCMKAISDQFDSTVSLVNGYKDLGNALSFRLKMYKQKNEIDFTCQYEGTNITGINVTTVK